MTELFGGNRENILASPGLVELRRRVGAYGRPKISNDDRRELIGMARRLNSTNHWPTHQNFNTMTIAQSQPSLFSMAGDKQVSDFATTLDLTPRQRAAERAAETEVRRGMRDIKRLGLEEEYESEEELPWGGLDAAFDLLQIFNFTGAGAAQEYLRTGSGYEAFKQAGVEFANALPGITLEGARRPVYSDVLKEGKVFSDKGYGRWASAVSGFLLDVILDPLTYTGFGALA